MKPVFQRIEFVRGDTFYISRYLKDKDGNILIINPATDEIIFTMKQDVLSSEVALTKTLPDIQLSEDGKFMIILEPKDTQEMAFGKYGYDIEVTIGVNEAIPLRRTVESGIINLIESDYSTHSNSQSGGE